MQKITSNPAARAAFAFLVTCFTCFTCLTAFLWTTFFTAYPGQALWGISLTDPNNLDPPPTPATAGCVWTTFMIMQGNPQYQGTSDLVVYGTMFWMFAPDTTRALQPEPYFAALTTISQNDLTPTTYCPNSRTWATNQANSVPWEAVMMPVSQPVGGSSPLAEA